MPLKTDTIEEPNLNLTPMIDIVFLLIIFFMVGSEFTEREREIQINLPKADVALAPMTEMPDFLVINVLDDGAIQIKDRQFTLSELKTELQAAKERYAEQPIRIRGDGDVRYERVMQVMGVCNSVGLNKVTLPFQHATLEQEE